MPPEELIGWLQLAALVVGIATLLIRIGSKDASLRQTSTEVRQLTEIVKDLVRSQIEVEVKHGHIREILSDLKTRLNRLEASRWGDRDSGRRLGNGSESS